MTTLAGELNRRLVQAGAPLQWLEEVATQALGAGDYQGAAALYFAARTRAPDRATERELFLKALADQEQYQRAASGRTRVSSVITSPELPTGGEERITKLQGVLCLSVPSLTQSCPFPR